MNRRSLTAALLIGLAAAGFAVPGSPTTSGQDSLAVPAKQLTVAPKVDGILSEGEWSGASHLTEFVDPTTGNPFADRTEAWLGYTKDAILVAFYCHDSKPDSLVGREIRPGADFGGEDTVSIRINPQGNRRYDGTSRFTINLLNTQNEEIAGGRAAKREWRGDWQSAVTRVSDGYVAEIRIPWRILNYPKRDRLDMDFVLDRNHGRAFALSRFPNTTLADRPEFRAIWAGVEPPAPKAERPYQFLGYVAPETREGKSEVRAGFDARWNANGQLNAVLSYNPDFRNIENVVAGIDFIRTERFLDDVRPFFTEGGQFFRFGSDYGAGQMFYTQRIQEFDLGGKVFGQVNPTLQLGALATHKFGGETNSVVRLEKNYGAFANSSVFASVRKSAARENQTLGFSSGFRRGNFNMEGRYMQENDPGERPDQSGEISATYSAPRFFSTVRAEWVPKNFDPALGFIPWNNRRGAYTYAEHGQEYRGGWLREYSVNLYGTNFEQFDGEEQQKGLDFGGSITTRNDTRIGFSRTRTRFFGALDDLWGGNLTLFSSNRFKRIRLSFDTGTRAGRQSRFFSVNTTRRLFKRLDVGLNASYQEYNGVDRLLIGTIGYEFDRLHSITGRVVKRDQDFNAYLAFRQGGGKGTEYFVILGDPNAQKTVGRLGLKVVWAF